jgi:hypothetical protein
MQTIKKYLILAFAVLMIFPCGISCSYMMDKIEAFMTDRSSFSIDVAYTPGSGIDISWDQTADGDKTHAGYEIYITERVNDQFADCIMIGAPYNTGNTNIFFSDSSLASEGTQSFNLPQSNVDRIINNTATRSGELLSMGPGKYFFRVAIYTWDDDPKSDYTGGESSWMSYIQSNYKIHTDFDQVSGAAELTLP